MRIVTARWWQSVIALPVLSVGAAIVACMGLLCACGDSNGEVSVPRPKGYPRIAPIGDRYVRIDDAPARLEVNAEATVARTAPSGQETPSGTSGSATHWITVGYPRYGAEIYYTFTPVTESTRSVVTDNRMERLSLNFSGVPVREREIVAIGGDFAGRVFTTRERCAFPVQFIMEGDGMVISGSLFMPSMALDADSVRPAADIVTRDILYGLRHLTVPR